MSTPAANPCQTYKLPSGKYAGQTIDAIIKTDPGYIQRCVRTALVVDRLRAVAITIDPLDEDGTSPVLCNCHESAALRTVKKPGPTHGRQFYGCAQWGPGSRESCGFFQWVTDKLCKGGEKLATATAAALTDSGGWACKQCTYVNIVSVARCAICDTVGELAQTPPVVASTQPNPPTASLIDLDCNDLTEMLTAQPKQPPSTDSPLNRVFHASPQPITAADNYLEQQAALQQQTPEELLAKAKQHRQQMVAQDHQQKELHRRQVLTQAAQQRQQEIIETYLQHQKQHHQQQPLQQTPEELLAKAKQHRQQMVAQDHQQKELHRRQVLTQAAQQRQQEIVETYLQHQKQHHQQQPLQQTPEELLAKAKQHRQQMVAQDHQQKELHRRQVLTQAAQQRQQEIIETYLQHQQPQQQQATQQQLPPGFERRTTEEGAAYYVNLQTGASSWELPPPTVITPI